MKWRVVEMLPVGPVDKMTTVESDAKTVDKVTEVMRARITRGESLDRLGEGLVDAEPYRGRT
jgi:hypothetical protein